MFARRVRKGCTHNLSKKLGKRLRVRTGENCNCMESSLGFRPKKFRFSWQRVPGRPAFVRPCSGLSQIACAPEMAGALTGTAWKRSCWSQHFLEGFQINRVRTCEDPEAFKVGFYSLQNARGLNPVDGIHIEASL